MAKLATYADMVRNDDFVTSELGVALFRVLKENEVVPFSPEGVELLQTAMRGVLQDMVDRRIYRSFKIEEVDVDDVSDDDKENRIMPDLKWSAVRASAIHRLKPVTGVISL